MGRAVLVDPHDPYVASLIANQYLVKEDSMPDPRDLDDQLLEHDDPTGKSDHDEDTAGLGILPASVRATVENPDA